MCPFFPQTLGSKVCVIHDVWTTKGGKRAFIGVAVSYIDDDWQFHVTHLTLKLIAWNHYGALLARPVGKFLIRHGLHKQIGPCSFFSLSPNVSLIEQKC